MQSLSPKETAAALRKILRASFPATTFSIVTERGSMVSSVRITWTDGPSTARVEAIAGAFEAGAFNGMTDSYDYDRSAFLSVEGTVCRPGCRYVFCNRHISVALATKCAAQVAAFWGGVTLPTIIEGYDGYTLETGPDAWKAIRPDLEAPRFSWYALIREAAEDATVYARRAE